MLLCIFRHANTSSAGLNKEVYALAAFTMTEVRYALPQINGLCSFMPLSEDTLDIINLVASWQKIIQMTNYTSGGQINVFWKWGDKN